ncbi:ornithine carbamoyltransferase [Ostreibacterium oceani]|uniref:Ornithine carbamoyltransferase n=1 Tax=Ostreibacterium oceani TaxID=2654998 RepID=A0A6N7EXP0_9GAMM|nr:ornithine carbamoyltransferase [Ostreibacterium oceani]MPV86713.1 ornithine carbamoyltransferase [Ostreibacterium oceani]
MNHQTTYHNPFYQQHLLKLIDYQQADITQLLNLAAHLKHEKQTAAETPYLQGKNIALIFEKASTRTRISFEVAAHDQGANVTYLGPSGSQIGHKESMADTARVLGRVYDAIQYRGYSQAQVEILAQYAGVPVYNGLTDDFHPTQGLADLFTMREHSNKPLSDIAYCFVGDCRFNMANTSLLAGAIMGMDVRLLCPDALRPNQSIIDKAQTIAQQSGAKITITADKDHALSGCDFVHTDVWVSMGEPESAWGERIALLRDFQVNDSLLEKTHNPAVKFMHCLPAFHNDETIIGKKIFEQYGLMGLEVSDSVFESTQSIVFDQSENRLHTIKAMMVATLVADLSFMD